MQAAQRSALMFILRAMKSTPTEALESVLNIVPIDLRLTNGSNKTSHEKWSVYHQQHGKKSKQQTVMSKHHKISINAIQISPEIPPFVETFYIPNLSVTIPNFHQTMVKRIT